MPSVLGNLPGRTLRERPRINQAFVAILMLDDELARQHIVDRCFDLLLAIQQLCASREALFPYQPS